MISNGSAAGRLEAACEKNEPPEFIEQLLQALTREIAPVLASLGKPDTAAVDTAAVTFDLGEIEPLLDEFRQLLAESDMKATVVLAEIEPVLSGTQFQQQLSAISLSIANYDFDEALELLNAIESA